MKENRETVFAVAVILAIGLTLLGVAFAVAALYAAFSPSITGENTRLGENATQVLTAIIAGMTSTLGTCIGIYSQRKRRDGEDGVMVEVSKDGP